MTTGGGEDAAAVVVGVSNDYKLPKIDGAADKASAWAQYLMATPVLGLIPPVSSV